MNNERTFLAVAEHCSLSKAADVLNVSKSTVSNRLSELEQYLGTLLVHRNSRGLVLTEIGRAYYEHIKIAIELTDEAESLVRSLATGVSGDISLNVPPGIVEHWLAKPLARILHEYPAINMAIHTTERVLEGLGKEADISIHWGELPDSSLHARRLFQDDIIFVAGAEYRKARKLDPKSSDIEFLYLPKNFAGDTQRRIASSAEAWWVYQMPSRVTVNSLEVLVALLLQNVGISILPKSYVKQHIESGALVDVTKEMQRKPFPVWCYAVTVAKPKVGGRIYHILQCIIEHVKR